MYNKIRYENLAMYQTMSMGMIIKLWLDPRLSKYNAQITSIYSVFVTKMIKKSMFNIAEESTCLKVPYWHSRLRFFAIFQKTIKQVNKNENCSVSNRQPKFLVIYNIARLQQKVVKKVYSFHFWKNSKSTASLPLRLKKISVVFPVDKRMFSWKTVVCQSQIPCARE